MSSDWRRVAQWYRYHNFFAAAKAVSERNSVLRREGDPRIIFADIIRYQFGGYYSV